MSLSVHALRVLPLFLVVVRLPAIASEDVLSPGSLSEVVERLFGFPVIPYDGQFLDDFEAAAGSAMQSINEQGIGPRRPNEVGNAVEVHVVKALRHHGFDAGTPSTVSGRRRSTGYPDIQVVRDGKFFYLEVKTYNRKNAATTQRSFYLSPSNDPKITRDACHLLIAFEMERREDGHYFARSVRLIDIANLPLRLKYEFNASNRDLYRQGNDLLIIEGVGDQFPPVRKSKSSSTR